MFLPPVPAVRGLQAREHLGPICRSRTTLCSPLGGRGAGGLRPPMAYRNFTPSLGVRELQGGGWCVQTPVGTRAVPCPKAEGPCLSRLASTSPPPEILGCCPPPLGSHGGNDALCPSQALCPQSKKNKIPGGASSGQQFLHPHRGQKVEHSLWEPPSGRGVGSVQELGVCAE